MKNYFKNHLKFGILFFGILLFQNCSKDNMEEIIEDNTKLLEILKQWGFTEENIVDKGDYYLVDGDIEFYKNKDYPTPPKDNLTSKGSNSSKISQTHSQYLVSQWEKDIRVEFSTEVSQDWITATISAMNAWNGICNVNFYTTGNDYNTADIKVYYGTGAIASGGFPSSNGKPGDHVKINDASYTWTADKKIMIIVHELGHNIGLLHSAGDGNTSNIPGTPDVDNDSVMYKWAAGRPWSYWGFSSYDVIAADWLFPTLTVNISGPIFGNNTSYYTWSASVSNGTPPYTYSWKRSSNQGQTYPYSWGSGGSSVTVQMPLDQDLYIKVTVTDSNGVTGEDYWVTENSSSGGGHGH